MKVQSVSTAFILISERLIEFNHVYYVSELSANLIFTELMKCQSYIHCDMQVDAENYFEFLSSINSDIFYTNLFHNNIYISSDSSLTFHEIMNDSMYEAVAYVAVLKSKAISTDYNSNAGLMNSSNRCLYILKDIIFQKDLHLVNSLILTMHNLKVLLNAACKAAAVISSVTSGLLTAVCKETTVISDSSIDNLFIDEEIRPELQNALNFSELTVESDDSMKSTRNITTVRKASVRNSLKDLLTDSEIAALLILKNLTHIKAFMKWKYYYKACVKEINYLKYTC
ncbi:hypothetical protein BDDG_12963 [Blastomyces dermatitidis ATCC 18188]|uniref:Uncharacterized protein n=1 Tax=Ajellomyces dermatitidis (strain ATCC 18188 / CBS 674.68) TaxID=653446 RepID=A0A0J9HHQ7_AJEDA|nr:hypothetical protein BDDG_12963 [Blastomyces dermatitidis ATCC 18188]